jgi:hypothetical protein
MNDRWDFYYVLSDGAQFAPLVRGSRNGIDFNKEDGLDEKCFGADFDCRVLFAAACHGSGEEPA